MKMLAPPEIGHFEMDNVVYERDEDGLFAVQLPTHAAAMRRLGAVEYLPGMPIDELFNPPVIPLQSDFDAALAAKDEEIARKDAEHAALMARFEALEKAVAASAAPAVPAAPAHAPGDTSSGQGGTTETSHAGDAMAAALAKNPKFDDMGRDDMVHWLKDVGVIVPASISKENARKAIDEAVADHKKGK